MNECFLFLHSFNLNQSEIVTGITYVIIVDWDQKPKNADSPLPVC